jgi:hypothetical protein
VGGLVVVADGGRAIDGGYNKMKSSSDDTNLHIITYAISARNQIERKETKPKLLGDDDDDDDDLSLQNFKGAGANN